MTGAVICVSRSLTGSSSLLRLLLPHLPHEKEGDGEVIAPAPGKYGKETMRFRRLDDLAKRSRIIGEQRVFFVDWICELEAWEISRLRNRLSDPFQSVSVIAYVAPPAPLLEAAFVHALCHEGRASLDLRPLWPHYRRSLEKLDSVFGEDKVVLRTAVPSALAGGNLVQDLYNQLGERRAPETGSFNEWPTLEAIALLFAHRKFGVRYRSYPEQAADNQALVSLLSGIGARKWRFAPSLIDPVIAENQDDLAWLEARLATVFPVREGSVDMEIASEQELLDVAEESLEQVKGLFKARLSQTDPTPSQIANWMEKLRIAVTGRAAHGGEPARRNPGFFSPEQRERLAAGNIGPVAALRELALAFERAGNLLEARNCLRAALELRPGAKGLLALHRRINARIEGRQA